MKLGVLTVPLSDLPLEAALEHIAELGLEAVELGTGGWPGNAHCDPAALLADASKLRAFQKAIAGRGLVISALSCHGNPLHPKRSVAKGYHDTFVTTVKLAAKLGVGSVLTFSGCPGAESRATVPAWITSPWPPEFLEMLEWQWEQRVVPYWKEAAKFAKRKDVHVAIEMHPNFIAYNPESMLRLRDVASGTIGCNFDPSHMWWQGIDPVAAIRTLGDCIYHVHAKDTRIDARNTAVNGVLDTKRYTRELERSWIFRTVGYGHDAIAWNDIISNLRLVGYDHVLSIEHEDSVMSGPEGLRKAVDFLKPLVIRQPPGEAYWA